MTDVPALLRAIKEAWNRAYEDSRAVELLPWVNTESPVVILKDFIRRIQWEKSDGKKIRILDFGCGNGRIGRILENNYGCEVYYYDISEKALDYCKSRGISEDRILYDVRGHDGCFDGIVVWGVFHHMDPVLWESQLELVTRLLSPEGLLLFGDFTIDDDLFSRENTRKSEVTQISSFAVDFDFLSKRLHPIYTGFFEFSENKSFSARRENARRMKYVIAERYLVDRKEAIVRQRVKQFQPAPVFWHFVRYTFKNSLTAPWGKAVTDICESDPDVARQLWLEGLLLFKMHDAVDGEVIIGRKSMTEELFLNSERKCSFYFSGEADDRISVEIRREDHKGFGYYSIILKATKISVD